MCVSIYSTTSKFNPLIVLLENLSSLYHIIQAQRATGMKNPKSRERVKEDWGHYKVGSPIWLSRLLKGPWPGQFEREELCASPRVI